MGTGKPLFVAIIPMDVELAESIHTLEFFEPIERNFAGTTDELEKFGAFLFIERSDSTPEPLDLRRGCRVVVVFGIVLPVIHVNFGQAGDQQLQLLLIEDRNELGRDNIVETYSN